MNATAVSQSAATLQAAFACTAGERGDLWGEYRRSGATGAWTQVGRQAYNCAATATVQKSFNLAGLSPATSYTARICADRSGSPPPQCWDADGTPHAPSEDSRTRSDVSFFTFTTLAASSSASTVSGATAVQAAAANPAYAGKTGASPAPSGRCGFRTSIGRPR